MRGVETTPARACLLCLDGAGMPHDGNLKLITSRVMVRGPEEQWETRMVPCFCECHAIGAGDKTKVPA
jgi:hypothetical protein